MKKKTTIIKEETITHTYCDVCEIEIKKDTFSSAVTCEICHKDLCNNCVGHEADMIGDFREVYCKTCWEVGESYRDAIKKHEDEIDRLNDEWREKCKQ